MASNDMTPTSAGESQHPDSTTDSSMLAVQHIQQRTDVMPSSTPVEMSQLDSPRSPEVERWTTPPTSTNDGSDYVEAGSNRENSASTAGQQERAPNPSQPLPGKAAPDAQRPLDTGTDGTSSVPIAIQAAATTTTTTPQAPAATTTEHSTADTSAIGPSAEDPATVITSNSAGNSDSSAPSVPITLLLTTGERHPFRIDRGYLEKRNVTTRGDDPFTISVYTMKELIWRDWRSGEFICVSACKLKWILIEERFAEWDARPTTPTSIRLIHFGKLLDDKQTLKGRQPARSA